MYASYFGLTEPPFSISPDPRYLYMSKRHREAMAHLVYGLQEGGGFVQLTGEVGTGKTTLCRCLMQQLPDNVDVALILNPQINHAELLATLCDELHLQHPEDATPKKLLDLLNSHLLETYAQGRRTVLLIDEAQLLTRAVLEQVRILTNLETTKHKLLQIILIGQPELSETLTRVDLRQLAQRITARYHLEPLNLGDTREYVKHRLAIAGGQRPLFSSSAMRSLYKFSKGVPRLINIICDRSLLGAYAEDKSQVSAAMLRDAAAEVLGKSALAPNRHWRWAIPAAAATLLLVPQIRGTILDGVYNLAPANPPEAASVQQSAPAAVPRQASVQPAVPAVVSEAVESPAMVEQTFAEPQASALPGRNDAPGAPADIETASLPEAGPVASAMDAIAQPDSSGPITAPTQTPDGQLFVSPDLPEPDLTPTRDFVPEPDAPRPFIEVLRSESPPTYAEVFSGLTSIWGFAYFPETADAGCKAVAIEGLRCWQRQGTWPKLRIYNRPALLTLRDNDDTYHVLVKGLGRREVMLGLGGRDYVYNITDIDPYWQGDFLMLWRPPPIRGPEINAASWGPDVLWLRQTLNRVAERDGAQPVDVTVARFDEGLQQRVIDFQKSNDLNTDGVVGSETMIQLNNILRDSEIPFLVPMS